MFDTLQACLACVKDAVSSDPDIFYWIDVTDLTGQEALMLEEVFGVHPLTTEDVLNEDSPGLFHSSSFLDLVMTCL